MTLSELRQHTPRLHSLLEDGNVLVEGLTEYEMLQEVRAARRGDGLFKTGGKPRFEVHYVNKDRMLDVKEASRWLRDREEEYSPE